MTTEQKATRKLRAILSADVKGYSRLMSEDEAHTIKTIKEYRRIITTMVNDHSGRVVDAPGDNLLAEFSSVVNAVQSSVGIQNALKEKNADLPEDKRLVFRIGVNIGDVVQDGDSLYGDGVNIAARIEGLADPGGVCISRNAYNHIHNKLNFGYEYLGEHSVKNIKNPVKVYKVLMDIEDAGKLIGEKPKPSAKKWVWPAVVAATIVLTLIGYQFYQKLSAPEFEPASIEKMAHPLPDKPSIAVLAFDNMTGDKEQEYFSDGLSEEIITALASVPELFVIARNSSFTYKGKPAKIQQISEELGVQYVLEGSVRKSGNNIRITAQLIDALKGHHLWAENFDRNIEDLFALQEEIAVNVITELRVKLRGNEKGVRIGEPCSSNLKAYLKYLKAAEHFRQLTPVSIAAARRLIEKAIELDPGYSCAYAVLGGLYRMDVYLGNTDSPMKSFTAAKKWYEKAVDVNPSNPGGQAGLANILSEIGLYEQAIEQAEKALTIDSNFMMSNRAMGFALYRSGRSKEAIPFYEKALRLDPFSTITLRQLGQAYFLSGQNEKAIETCEKLIDRTPQYLPGHLILAAAYSAADLMDEANAAASVIIKMNPKFTLEKYSKKLRFKNPADKELIISNLRKAGLPDKPPLSLPDKPSIAVLAFDNMSGDPEQEYFSDGISENIISTLSRTDQLFVIARNSTFTYKGKPVKVKQVAEELGVRYVVEGSVQKSENQVRITAQLIDATTGHHLWAERYDRNLKDIFGLQDEITMKIVTALQVKLTSGEQVLMMSKHGNLEVYLKHLEAMSFLGKDTNEGLIRYGQIGKEIVDMEPDLATGYRILSWYNFGLAMQGKSPQKSIKKAFKLAQKALSIDESDAYSHALSGNIYLLMKQYENAVDAGKRSIELDPNGANHHSLLGRTLSYADRPDEAIGYLKKGLRLDPFPAYWYYINLGRCYRQRGQYNQALTEYKKGLHLSPDSFSLNLSLAIIYVLLDRQEEAVAAAKKTLERNPDFSVTIASKTWPYKNSGELKLLVDAMRKAGLPD